MKESILELVRAKRSGANDMGENCYSNITETDLNEIISASIIFALDKIDFQINTAGDERETIEFIEQESKKLREEFEYKPNKTIKFK